MPRIPRSGRQVQEQIFSSRGVSAKAPVVGAGNAQALQTVASTVQGIDRIVAAQNREAERKKKEFEDNEIEAFKNRLRKKQDELIHDKKTGFRNLQGKDAGSSFDKYSTDYNDFVKAEIEALGTDSLKQRATLDSQRFSMDYNRQLNNHAANETERYEDQTFEDTMVSVREHATANIGGTPQDRQKVSEALAKQKEQIDKFAARKGLDKKSTDVMKLKASSNLHESVINKMLAEGEDGFAKTYLDDVQRMGNQLDTETSTKLEKIVYKSNVKGQAQRGVNDIINQNLSYGDTIDAARKAGQDSGNPDLEDEMVRRAKNRWNEKKEIEREQQRVDFQSLADQLEQYKTLDHVSEAEIQKLSTKKQKVLRKMSELISKGVTPKTDPIVEQDLSLMSQTDRDKFLKTDINEYMHKLSAADRRKYIDLQGRLRKGDKEVNRELDRMFSDTQLINNHMELTEIKKDKDQALFRSEVEKRARQWKVDNEKKYIPQSELVKIMDNLTLQTTEEDGGLLFFDKEKPLFKADRSKILTNYDDIPSRVRDRIEERYQNRRGSKPGEAEVERIYKLMIGKGQ